MVPYFVNNVELRAEEKIGKFGFTSLGIVEVHSIVDWNEKAANCVQL